MYMIFGNDVTEKFERAMNMYTNFTIVNRNLESNSRSTKRKELTFNTSQNL